MADLNETLKERGARYGKFRDMAAAARELQCTISSNSCPELASDQELALDMICVKIARIITGDPNYSDSWHDIAGYAKLVADRLDGIEQ